MQYDGSLIFNTEIDGKQLQKEIGRLKGTTVRIGATLDFTGFQPKAKDIPPVRVKAAAEKPSGSAFGWIGDGINAVTKSQTWETIMKIKDTVLDAAKAGDEVDKTSQKLGMSTEGYQEWSYVLEQNGASSQTLQTSMESLNGVIDEAKSGNRAAAEQFAKLGVEVESLGDRSREDIFGAVVAGLQGVDDEGERAGLAAAFFGGAARELIPTLGLSAEETEALKKEAHSLGLVMGEESVDASASLAASYHKLERANEGLVNQMSAKLMPALSKFYDMAATFIGGIASLFAEPPKNELTPQIEAAEDKLSNIKGDLKTISSDYAGKTFTIKVAYENDLKTVDEYFSLPPEQRDKETVSALVPKYAGLEDYTTDGYFQENPDAIRGVMGEEAERQKKIEFARMALDYQQARDDAQAQADMLYKEFWPAEARKDKYEFNRLQIDSVAARFMAGQTNNIDTALALTGAELAAAKIAFHLICSLHDRQYKRKPSLM